MCLNPCKGERQAIKMFVQTCKGKKKKKSRAGIEIKSDPRDSWDRSRKKRKGRDEVVKSRSPGFGTFCLRTSGPKRHGRAGEWLLSSPAASEEGSDVSSRAAVVSRCLWTATLRVPEPPLRSPVSPRTPCPAAAMKPLASTTCVCEMKQARMTDYERYSNGTSPK